MLVDDLPQCRGVLGVEGPHPYEVGRDVTAVLPDAAGVLVGGHTEQ
ncbi:hypothetical protein ACFXPZ_25530 [Streptomyces sp. NPDC059101]